LIMGDWGVPCITAMIMLWSHVRARSQVCVAGHTQMMGE
jgi:hypothetical protein